MSLALYVLAALASVAIAIAAYRLGQSSVRRGRREKTAPVLMNDSPDPAAQRTGKLQEQVDNLNELNRRYLAFIVNMSTVLQRLNMTLSTNEIISSITHLVRNVVSTDVVEVYTFDAVDNLLKKVDPPGEASEETISVPLGEGLVGMAAQTAGIRIKGRHSVEAPEQGNPDSRLWLAVPINFGNRLFGVIGVGQVRNPSGNESQLMKIIADIAGVALINRSLLGEARQEANTDPLTGLNNRRYFFRMAEVAVEKAIREGDSPISIFLFDVDNFKHYNDTNGHEEGDGVLKELARLVLEVTRRNCVVARFGGEEFIVMLPGVRKEDTLVYAERLRETVSAHPFPNREKQPLGCLSISGGIASFPFDARSINWVIRLADAALYRAKSEGKNRVLMHQPFYFSDFTEGRETSTNG
jgi:diguanylate cyclase (GGDEF)-like protein